MFNSESTENPCSSCNSSFFSLISVSNLSSIFSFAYLWVSSKKINFKNKGTIIDIFLASAHSRRLPERSWSFSRTSRMLSSSVFVAISFLKNQSNLHVRLHAVVWNWFFYFIFFVFSSFLFVFFFLDTGKARQHRPRS